MGGNNRNKESCTHNYVLNDYDRRFDIAADIVEVYEIICTKCSKSRNIDGSMYGEMKRIGIIKEAE